MIVISDIDIYIGMNYIIDIDIGIYIDVRYDIDIDLCYDVI